MAKVCLEGEYLTVRLNPLERVMALRRNLTVPYSAVERAYVLEEPWDSQLFVEQIAMGFAARTAEGQIACVGARARFGKGKALLIVWLNRASVTVELKQSAAPWSLLVVSCPRPTEVVNEISIRVSHTP